MYWTLITRPGQGRAETHAQVHIRRQDGERQTDGQVNHEREGGEPDDLAGDTVTAGADGSVGSRVGKGNLPAR